MKAWKQASWTAAGAPVGEKAQHQPHRKPSLVAKSRQASFGRSAKAYVPESRKLACLGARLHGYRHLRWSGSPRDMCQEKSIITYGVYTLIRIIGTVHTCYPRV